MSVSDLRGRGNSVAGKWPQWQTAVIEEVARVVSDALGNAEVTGAGDLEGIEQRVQPLLRRLGGLLTTALALRAVADCPRPCCPRCGQSMQLRNRRCRQLCGLTGDLQLERAEFHCRNCGEVAVPAEGVWKLGREHLTPALQRVLARASAEVASFERGADLVGDILGLKLTADTAARTTTGALPV